ncbi:MAG: type II toxin-antitoxin system VapC family toxin [Gemmatimonadaceae bacterium]|nr:type II toxin-antitoxin system VapC family toxin [Gemmatimonadaceae bacterium]
MRYLLDTNILSELVKPRPNQRVSDWVEAQAPLDLLVSVLSLGEVQRGIARLPDGPRRRTLIRWAGVDLPSQFAGRLLDVDLATSLAWGTMGARAAEEGRPLPTVDGLLLATAEAHGLTLVTRNTADCAHRGVPVYDPWSGESTV